MDLLSGNPYWQTTVAKPPVYPSLEEDIECDVLIIGGEVQVHNVLTIYVSRGLMLWLLINVKQGMGVQL